MCLQLVKSMSPWIESRYYLQHNLANQLHLQTTSRKIYTPRVLFRLQTFAIHVRFSYNNFDYNATSIALYAGFGEKLASNSKGLLLALQESGSLTPQTVIPTHLAWFRQALTTCKGIFVRISIFSLGSLVTHQVNGTYVHVICWSCADNIKFSDGNFRNTGASQSVNCCDKVLVYVRYEERVRLIQRQRFLDLHWDGIEILFLLARQLYFTYSSRPYQCHQLASLLQSTSWHEPPYQ